MITWLTLPKKAIFEVKVVPTALPAACYEATAKNNS